MNCESCNENEGKHQIFNKMVCDSCMQEIREIVFEWILK